MRSPLRLLPLLALAWFSLVGGYAGCDFFTPTVPEGPPPDPGRNVVRENFSEPESTLATIQRAVANRVLGQTAYTDALWESSRNGRDFFALFPREVQDAIGRTGAGWGWLNEQQFYGVFIATKGSGRDSLALAVIPADPDSEYTGGDVQVLVRHYELWVLPTGSSGGAQPQRYAIGNARLTFARSGTRWLLLKWDDRVDPTVGLNTASDDLPFSWRRLETIG